MTRALQTLASLLVAVGVVYSLVCFRVGEWESAIVLQFGKPVRTVMEPGLNTKLPFIQNVVYFEKRMLEYDAAPRVLITTDKQQLVVDNFARWRIVEPLVFYKSVLTEAGAQSRLDDIIYSSIREAAAKRSLYEIVSGDREDLLASVTEEARAKAGGYGIEIIDVRIKRADLPEKNEQNVYRRMRTERERQAKKFRAEGEEESRKIRSRAAREREVLLADAKREAELLRGEGDAKAIKIYADAYERDPEFYAFQRTLEAYRKSLGEGTRIVLTPSSEFLSGLQSSK